VVDLTGRAWVRLLMVVEPETVSWLIVVVAKVLVPVTARVPPTVSRLEMVVEPVIPKVLDAVVQVKLPLPPVVVAAV